MTKNETVMQLISVLKQMTRKPPKVFDIVNLDQYGYPYGSCPPDTFWCSICDKYEYSSILEDPFLLEEHAPISYVFWKIISKRYSAADNAYRLWVDKGCPRI